MVRMDMVFHMMPFLRNITNLKPVYEEEYLHSFFIALFLSSVLIFYTTMSALNEMNNSIASIKGWEYINRFIETGTETDISVLIIGDSRVRHAARFGIEAGDTLTLQNGKKVAALQFSIDAAEFSDFAALESALLTTRPDYLFIGRQMLSNNRPAVPPMALSSYWVAESIIRKLGNRSAEQVWQESRAGTEACYDGQLTRRMLALTLQAIAARDKHSLDPETNPNLAGIRDFIEKIRRHGTKVVILHLMPNMDAMERLGAPLHLFDAYGIGRFPAQKELLPEQHDKVIWLEYQGKRGEKDYCDFVHLNESARPDFREWFTGLMTEWSENPP